MMRITSEYSKIGINKIESMPGSPITLPLFSWAKS